MPRPKKIQPEAEAAPVSKYRRKGVDALGNPIKPQPVGRPTVYTPEIAKEIIDRLLNGESLVKIAEDERMPSRVTIYNWMDRDPDFCTKCARAREGLADYLVDEIEKLARSATKDNIEVVKLQISVAQWRAMKMAPRQYGDRRTTELTGKDGGPIQTEAKVAIDASKLDPDAREALRAAALAVLDKG